MADCLVLIDVQNGFLSDRTKEVPGKLMELIKTKKFDHIVGTQFINVEGSPYIKLMNWHGLMDEVSRTVDENVKKCCERIFVKTIYSCFNQEFSDYIRDNKIDKLYFAGIDTDCCVLKSATDCFERNISFEVLINYCASNGGVESHNAAIKVLERTIGRQNINYTI